MLATMASAGGLRGYDREPKGEAIPPSLAHLKQRRL